MRRPSDFEPSYPAGDGQEAPLAQGRPGFRGVVTSIDVPQATGAGELPAAEMERRLLEMGFVEGARIEVLHEGLFGGDPIAVKLDDMRVALRRRDAEDVWVRLDTK